MSANVLECEPELREVLDPKSPIGFYLRASRFVRLLTAENVERVMAQLVPPFRDEFLAFAREAYLPIGPRVTIAGSPIPESCLEAIRGWFASYAPP